MSQQRQHNRMLRVGSESAIPGALLGDWESNGERYRFNYDGNYSLVVPGSYTIEDDEILHLRNESYVRRAGTTGLIGTWRATFDEGEWIDMVLGPYAFYAFVWNDGSAGGGYYTANDTELFMVEQRAIVSCTENQIIFTSASGVESGTFSINGANLTIKLSDGPIEYSRIPF